MEYITYGIPEGAGNIAKHADHKVLELA